MNTIKGFQGLVMTKPYRDSNPRRAIIKWRELGGTAEHRPGTDDMIYRHPALLLPLRVKQTRHDTANIVLKCINQLMKAQHANP